jgi:transcription elongation GreA/GreB family factor
MFGVFLAVLWCISVLVVVVHSAAAYKFEERVFSSHRAKPEAMPVALRQSRVVATVCTGIISFGLVYYFMPVASLDFSGIWVILLISLALLGAVWHVRLVLFMVPVLLVLFWVVQFAITSPMLHSERYAAMMGPEKEAQFSATLPPIDIEQAPLVSYDMALRAMEKRLADVPGLGSQVYVGHPVKQIVNGRLLWVSFLHHHGFVKWFLNHTTPGYVTVSATNPSDVRLVQTLQGNPIALRYLTSASFGDNVRRHAYRSGLTDVGLADITPEIDDEGKPFYVVSLYEHKVGFSGSNVTGIATIDAQTGDVKRYNIANMPRWIDRAQPEQFVAEQLNDRGQYVHGYFNFSGKDRLRVSGDLDLVYSREGHAYWFAGETSFSSDAGLVGFVLIDSRTKQARHFKIAAVTESVASSVVENVNPEKHYQATNPLPFMVEGIPTYVMGLTDSQGVARAYGMVSMQNHQIVAVAETLAATLRLYEAHLSANKTQADIGTAAKLVTINATVRRIASESRGTQTNYYLVLESAANVDLAKRIFTATSDVSEELVLTQHGDEVEVQVTETTSRIQSIVKFDNKAVGAP